MKTFFTGMVAVLAIVLLVVIFNPLLQGWAVQNNYDRIQARTQANAEWALEQAQRQAVSEAWVDGWKSAIPVFWGLISFLLVLIGGAVCLVVIRLAMSIRYSGNTRVVEYRPARILDVDQPGEITAYRVPELERRR